MREKRKRGERETNCAKDCTRECNESKYKNRPINPIKSPRNQRQQLKLFITPDLIEDIRLSQFTPGT
jgi:hypothetical protein